MTQTSQPRPSKAARREAARLAAERIRLAEERAARRTRRIVIAVSAAAVLALVAIVAVAFLSRPAADDVPAASVRDTSVALEDAARPAASDTVSSPAVAGFEDALTGGIAVGADGVAGTENPGAVVVDVYYDYMCPICGTFEEQAGPELTALREAGEITLVSHPIAILDRYSQGTLYSTRAAAAAGLVADRAPEAFLAFSDALFAAQPEENTTGLSDAEIADAARAAGVPEDVVAGLDGWPFAQWATSATVRSSEMGVQGTPTIYVDGTVFSGDWRVSGALTAAVQDAQARR